MWRGFWHKNPREVDSSATGTFPDNDPAQLESWEHLADSSPGMSASWNALADDMVDSSDLRTSAWETDGPPALEEAMADGDDIRGGEEHDVATAPHSSLKRCTFSEWTQALAAQLGENYSFLYRASQPSLDAQDEEELHWREANTALVQ